MKSGKISEAILKRSVLKQLHIENAATVVASSIGEDCGAVKLEKACQVAISSDPIFGDLDDPKALAERTVLRAINNLAAAGATPLGLSMVVLLPTSAKEPQLRKLMEELERAAKAFSMDILSGHTEVTRSVSQCIVMVTAMGKANEVVRTSGVKPGMDIVVSKWIALSGTLQLLERKKEALREHFSQPFLNQAKKLEVCLPILSEAAVAVSSGVSAMHDVSEGGIFGALWDMAEASGVGLEIDLKKIPIRQETVEICEYLGVNPYKLVSGGCLLMATEDGLGLVRELENQGIPCALIGKATHGNDRVLINEDERRFLETPQKDEIYLVE